MRNEGAGARHDDASPLGGASRLLAELEAWVAAAAADEAVHDRRRLRSMAEQATEEASLAGVLLDLAERGVTVALTTTEGRQHLGRILVLGADLVLLGLQPRGLALVRLAVVAAVRTAPGSVAVTGDRTARLAVTWADAAGVLAADRTRVRVGLAGGSSCAGELRSVGTDVALVVLDGDGGRAYVPLDAMIDVVVDDVGVTQAFR